MFTKKKNTPQDENVAKQGIRTIDRVVTGLLLGGIIASIYGVKKIREHNQHEEMHHNDDAHALHDSHEDETFIGEAPPKAKQGLLSRIIFGNK